MNGQGINIRSCKKHEKDRSARLTCSELFCFVWLRVHLKFNGSERWFSLRLVSRGVLPNMSICNPACNSLQAYLPCTIGYRVHDVRVKKPLALKCGSSDKLRRKKILPFQMVFWTTIPQFSVSTQPPWMMQLSSQLHSRHFIGGGAIKIPGMNVSTWDWPNTVRSGCIRKLTIAILPWPGWDYNQFTGGV